MDIKPTFIFFFGISWSGTTSLFNTLEKNLYMHGGGCKEPSFLGRIDKNAVNIPNSTPTIVGFEQEIKYYRKYYLTKAKPFIDVLRNIPEYWWDDKIKNYKNFTLDDYINYYRDLSYSSKKYYTAVGDFSNSNELLTYDFLVDLKSRLEEHFTVKAISIHRDPVRRIFSKKNALCHNELFKYMPEIIKKTEGYNSTIEYFLDTIHLNPHSALNTLKIQKVFGEANVHNIIMEKFFIPDKDEVALLENFLNYKLSIITPCTFVPDRGINALKIEGLQDQWDSDHEILTPEIYAFARKELEEEYQRYQEIFGDRLPEDWGKPIDYGY
jgi:hypothetical protein